jgi:hypothetical protein
MGFVTESETVPSTCCEWFLRCLGLRLCWLCPLAGDRLGEAAFDTPFGGGSPVVVSVISSLLKNTRRGQWCYVGERASPLLGRCSDRLAVVCEVKADIW